MLLKIGAVQQQYSRYHGPVHILIDTVRDHDTEQPDHKHDDIPLTSAPQAKVRPPLVDVVVGDARGETQEEEELAVLVHHSVHELPFLAAQPAHLPHLAHTQL